MSTIILLIFSFLTSNLQEKTTFDASKFTLDGISCFQTTEAEIKKTYGDVVLTETDYECGFFSVDQPGSPYFQMIYPNINWIGNSKEGYQIDEIKFDPEGKIQLKYEDFVFSGLNTQEELESFMGEKSNSIQIHQRDDEVLRSLFNYFDKSDDALMLILKGGKLIEFHYWSPC
ncbi:hypothetical protein [Algoriphagus sp. PAP.12]|uniref:hypothetical protein n=1 Tax=Algoriphagus sp. PAP.12 TaxID=2996678 RepID=UPI00227A4012|nr:hypothetical protein [Algoriphagus sp. PAP.12]